MTLETVHDDSLAPPTTPKGGRSLDDLPGYGKVLTKYALDWTAGNADKGSENEGADEESKKESADDFQSFPAAVLSWCANTTTLRERAMLWFMDQITDKPEWERKVFDEEIVQKWKKELEGFVQAEQESIEKYVKEGGSRTTAFVEPLAAGFSDNMFDYCLKELREKAEILKQTGFVSVYDSAAMIVKSDSAVGEDLRQKLLAAVKPLEDVPAADKDWHPGSDDTVLDLVHPSLFPLVYGKTRVLPGRLLGLDDCLEAYGSGETIPVPVLPPDPQWSDHSELYSTKFQWLPCEVQFTDGVAKIQSYVNNLHPVKHRALYPLLEQVMTAALPAVASVCDRALTWDADDQRSRVLISYEDDTCTHDDECASCSPKDHTCAPMYPDEEEVEWGSEEWEKLEEEAHEWYEANHQVVHSDPEEYLFHGSRFESDIYDQWKNRRLQVIVKLANIELTPENHTYKGGSWHVEGQLNERIAATALYYYDNDNITESKLEFRTQTNSEDMQQNFPMAQNDHRIFCRLVGIPGVGHQGDASTVLDVGDVSTRQGRLLVFPNVYQHCVSSFELADKTRPGHRKILALFFVAPDEPVISTAHVPPQQLDWASVGGVESRLPRELADEVYKELGCPYPLAEAKRLRLELIEERRGLDEEADKVIASNTWGFCEH